MQENPSTFSLSTILSAAAAIVSFLAVPLSYLLGNRKRIAEASQSKALTRKTDAEAWQISNGMLIEAWDQMNEMEDIIRGQNIREIQDKRRIAYLEFESETKEAQIKLQEQEIRTAGAELTLLRALNRPGA